MASAVRMADGTFDFSGGIDSASVTTVQSEANPLGLPRNMLAWLTNGTVRGGGVTQRDGFANLCKVHDGTALYQGGYLYEPLFGNPYAILQIGGRIYQVRLDTDNSVVDLSAKFGLTNPANVPQVFMCQGEQFLIIQAGDLSTNPTPTLPLIWDGVKLRRSVGIIGPNNTPNGGITPFNELPAAGPMVYYQGRLWYAIGRTYTAGDIVDGPSGTPGAPYFLKDSILKVTENPLALGGDSFTVPNNAGNITALAYTANIDTTLGQGLLYIFTRRQVYALNVPVTRAAWIAADASNRPVQTIQQIKFGAVSDRCVVHVNGDLFYQSLEPSIRSLFISTRFFQQWGNVAISRNVDRALAFNNRALMPFATGIEFDNRMLQGILPVQTPVGVAFQAIAVLDYDIISSLGREQGGTRPPPAWEGMYEGLDVLQLFEGDFGGLQRAFSVSHSRADGSIQVWELTDFATRDNGDNRVTWYFESPAFTWSREFDLKELDGGELWFDTIAGEVDLTVEYRVDADPCWQTWHKQKFCAARTDCELPPGTPHCYPTVTFCEGFKFPITLPKPQTGRCESMSKRPTNRGYQFQVRVTLKGFCRVRGVLLFALPIERKPFEGAT
jgi:hypothetical protein